jgi:hypothetical protein
MKSVESDFLDFIACCEPDKPFRLSCFSWSPVLEVDIIPVAIEFVSVFDILDEIGVSLSFFDGVCREMVESCSYPDC